METDIYRDSDVEVDKRYIRVRYCAEVVVITLCLPQDVAWEQLLRTGGRDWEKIDVMDYALRTSFWIPGIWVLFLSKVRRCASLWMTNLGPVPMAHENCLCRSGAVPLAA